jgi:hypothetical protein
MKKFDKQFGLLIVFLVFFLSFGNAQSLLYYNNFNSGQSAWKDYDDALSNAKVAGGKYTLTHKQHLSSIVANVVPTDYNKDFAIETTLTHVAGEAFPTGITFAGSNSLNTYYFCIISTGQFIIAGFEHGANKIIVNWTPSIAIAQGSGLNKLRIEKSDNQFRYFINDTQVAQTAILPRYGDAVGLMVSGQQTVSFDYLKVTYLDPVVKPMASDARALSLDIKEMAYHTDFDKDDQNAWILKATDSVSTSIANGYYNILRRAKLGITESVTDAATKVDMHRDYLVETSAVHYNGTANYGYGLDFACDSARQYHFWISPSGYYSIGYSHAGGYNVMTPWTASNAIIKTALALNKLSIAHKAGQLSFYVNDQLVTSYPDLVLTGHRFGVSVGADQTVGFDYLTIGYLDKAQPVPTLVKADATPPEIIITSPQVTRGLKVVQSSDVLHVAGVAKSANGIFSVVVNGTQAKVEANGNFTADVPMAIGDNPLMVVATDMNMNKGTYRFNIVRNDVPAAAQANVTQTASQGKFYALLIGVQDYQDQTIQSLEGPVGDASNLLKALADNYTFSSENITLLKSPTRSQFFKALDDLTTRVTADDNVVIFYAGHGYYDDANHQGYWFPSDAIRTRKDTWISNADLIDYITEIKAKHTLLISDACFGGSIFKTRAIEMAPKDIQELYKLPSRKAMTSGNMKEVPDNSVFMHYLIERLSQNTDKFLPAEQLFSSFRAAVINNSPNQQVPQFGEIREAGDEGGDFIFIHKN